MPGSIVGKPTAHIVAIPEIASEAALLHYLGLSPSELNTIWWHRRRMYHLFEIGKKGGKAREIKAPDERLKFLQRKLLSILDCLYRVRNPVHGFVEARSVKTNASAHLTRKFLVNIDLKDFFPSISENRISGVLRALGVDSRVSQIIAKICCLDSRLPQGAPTSPVLSNMICFRLDKELLAYAKASHCIYTRYADDLTLSSHRPPASLFEGQVPPPGRFSPELLAATLRSLIVANGFQIHPNKAHFADRNSRRMVTGLKVNEFLNVDRRYVRNIRSALFSIETLGLAAAQTKFEDVHGGNCKISLHLEGKLIWLRHVRGQSDPVFRGIALRFNKLFPSSQFSVTPTEDELRDRAVWVIEHFEGEMAQGSAFFVREIGLVTAAHCVEHVDKLEIYHPSKPANRFEVYVLQRDAHLDLAILKHSIPPTEFFEFERAKHPPTVGADSVAAGYPGFGPGDRLNVRQGKVSSLPIKHGVKMIEVTQKLSQGMSGGPLLDSSNLVVGVIHKGGHSEERDFAIHVDVLSAWAKP